MKEIKARYRLILADNELNEMFVSPTLEEALRRIRTSKTHDSIRSILIITLILLWLLIAKNMYT